MVTKLGIMEQVIDMCRIDPDNPEDVQVGYGAVWEATFSPMKTYPSSVLTQEEDTDVINRKNTT